jgi:uncharacterized membrane protein YkgB
MFSKIMILPIAMFMVFIFIAFYKKETTVKIIEKLCMNKPFMQSPEYRCSTKCFDCIQQRTFNHLNPSHGNPRLNVGL